MSGLLLDTHVWLWTQRGETSRLSESFVEELEQQQVVGSVCLSAISVWEVAQLVASKGYLLGDSVEGFLAAGTVDGGLRVVDVTPRILIESTRLPGELHRDPADRILIATARELGLTLVTRDKLLLQYARKGHVNARKP